MIVSLDSHILVWGIKGEASQGQEDKIPHAKKFFAWLEKEKHQILLSAVVVGELLMRVPPQEHAEALSFFEKRFKIIPYDTMSASIFATIWQKKNEDKTIDWIKEKLQATREECKADCQIVASLISKKVDCLYSYDKKLIKFADGFIETREMPEIVEQQNLFTGQ